MGQHGTKTEGWWHDDRYCVVVRSAIVDAMSRSCEQESGRMASASQIDWVREVLRPQVFWLIYRMV